MSLPWMGHAIIINNVAAEMPGSAADVEALQAAYKNVGFNVHCYSDCTEEVCYLHVGFNVQCYSECTEEVSYLQQCRVRCSLLQRR